MQLIRQLGILILLLVSCLPPATVCMISHEQMNAEGRACCQAMVGQCEQMKMPSARTCCRKTPQNFQDSALYAKVATYHPILVVALWLAVSDWSRPALTAFGWINDPGYSPPRRPPGSVSILRL
ncbi:hypothetical protein [Silvibacterium sp.]|uniref:hypothetical protein n=1 Tax=Silvibacterium sp. TaxID=1964179 RepID=UPI0039E5F9D2